MTKYSNIFIYRTQSGIDRVFYARDSECGSPRFVKDVFSSLHLSFVNFLFICLVMLRCHVKTVIRFCKGRRTGLVEESSTGSTGMVAPHFEMIDVKDEDTHSPMTTIKGGAGWVPHHRGWSWQWGRGGRPLGEGGQGGKNNQLGIWEISSRIYLISKVSDLVDYQLGELGSQGEEPSVPQLSLQTCITQRRFKCSYHFAELS